MEGGREDRGREEGLVISPCLARLSLWGDSAIKQWGSCSCHCWGDHYLDAPGCITASILISWLIITFTIQAKGDAKVEPEEQVVLCGLKRRETEYDRAYLK